MSGGEWADGNSDAGRGSGRGPGGRVPVLVVEEALALAFAEAAGAARVLTVFAADAFFNSAGIAVLLAMVLPL